MRSICPKVRLGWPWVGRGSFGQNQKGSETNFCISHNLGHGLLRPSKRTFVTHLYRSFCLQKGSHIMFRSKTFWPSPALTAISWRLINESSDTQKCKGNVNEMYKLFIKFKISILPIQELLFLNYAASTA